MVLLAPTAGFAGALRPEADTLEAPGLARAGGGIGEETGPLAPEERRAVERKSIFSDKD